MNMAGCVEADRALLLQSTWLAAWIILSLLERCFYKEDGLLR